MGPTTANICLQILLYTSLAQAAIRLPPALANIGKTAPKPAQGLKPNMHQFTDSLQKGIEGVVSLYNPPQPTTTATRTAASTPVRLTAAWATTPAALAARAAASTVPPSCPRAQVYLAYCSTWYASDWTAANAAFCLCQGESLSDADALVYVPDLFDGDAAGCVEGYGLNADYYSSMAVSADGEGYGELATAYASEYELATEARGAWEAAATFCGANPPEDEGVESVEPGYFVTAVEGAQGRRRRRGVPAVATPTPTPAGV